MANKMSTLTTRNGVGIPLHKRKRMRETKRDRACPPRATQPSNKIIAINLKISRKEAKFKKQVWGHSVVPQAHDR